MRKRVAFVTNYYFIMLYDVRRKAGMLDLSGLTGLVKIIPSSTI